MIRIEKASVEDIPAIEALYFQLFEYISELQPQSFRKAEQDNTYIK